MVVNSLEICLKVRSIDSSLTRSRWAISSSMADCDSSSSFLRFSNCSCWAVKLLYCSYAFLLTCVNFFRLSLTAARRLFICACSVSHCRQARGRARGTPGLPSMLPIRSYLSNASSGSTPRSRMSFAASSAGL